MTRSFAAALCGISALSAYDGENPFDDVNQETNAPTEPGANTDPDNIYATDLNEDLTMNAFGYNDQGTADPTDDTLTVNTIPFDN